MKRLLIGAVALVIVILGVTIALPPQTRTQPASAGAGASDTVEPTKCPPANDKGAYFERGVDKDGNAICGFAYYNACPYVESAEAGTPECEKAKPTPEQLERWQPEPETTEPTKVNSCKGD